ncbi:DUF6049 family protein [Nocardia carnea]|uniref:DUF6049 family protein n=1 Tax=Nocardia carnea TaxID=37328 RepID=UPI002454A31E|nr:DUF6049 family protein [Nocardia carnea]
MTRGPSRIIFVILTILGAVTALSALPVTAAYAQPTGSAEDTGAPQFLKLSLDSVSPGTVTTASEPLLTVTGTVTNIGDRGVDAVTVRVQRSRAVADPSELRTTLKLDQASYDHPTPFQDIAARLEPGQRQQFTLSVPLRDGSGESLNITEPGVYPLLLNVNGTPDYGGQARLDDARFLLPVLGLPAAADGSAPPLPAPANPAVSTTLLWPLADRPRMVAGQTGELDRTVELTDDELAASLGRGGRLDELVGALETVVGDDRAADGPASAICLAVDPDLLLTVQAMTEDYRVLASPSDPDGATRPGSGTEAAKQWLDRVRSLASSMCTVALPFAQVDISALAAADDPALTARALEAPAQIVDSILNTRSVRGVSLPDASSLDPAAAQLLKSQGFETAVLARNAVAPEGGAGDPYAPVPDVVRLPGIAGTAPPPAPTPSEEAEQQAVPAGGPAPAEGQPAPPGASAPPNQPGSGGAATRDPALRVATFDIWPAAALAGIGSNPPTPAYVPESARYPVTNDSRSARLQDALGAVSWQALHADPGRPRSQLIMPPQQWGANRDEAVALLRQLELLVDNKLVDPRPFDDLVGQAPDPAPYQLAPLPDAALEAVPGHFAIPARDQSNRLSQLLQAMVEVPETQPTPRAYLDPLRDDLVRSLSLSDRRGGPTGQAEVFAQRRIEKTTAAVDEIYRSVTVLPPGGVYTLASESSPLLLVARNDLPISMRIRFRIDAPPETKITDIGEQLLPPRGTRSFQIPTEVSDSRNLVVPISLSTPEGVPLGHATSISVRSNAYGQILAIITACAAALLFLLAGRRLWRRFHGERDPADKGVDPGVRRRVIRLGRARRRESDHADLQVSSEALETGGRPARRRERV